MAGQGMRSQQGLRSIPGFLIDDRRMLASIVPSLMGEPADINGVRQDLVEMAAAKQAAAGFAPRAVDAERQAVVLAVEGRLQRDNGPAAEIAAENLAHDGGVVV